MTHLANPPRRPQIDYNKLQQLGGYKNVASATSTFCGVKKKLLSSDPASVKLTSRDREILVMVWECFKTNPQVDYNKLQQLGGYKNVASAASTFCGVKKKLLSVSGDGTPAPIKRGPRKRKAKGEDDELPNKRSKLSGGEDGSVLMKDGAESATDGHKAEIQNEDDEPGVTTLLASAQDFLEGGVHTVKDGIKAVEDEVKTKGAESDHVIKHEQQEEVDGESALQHPQEDPTGHAIL